MDFELKTLDLDGACAAKCDALIVLVPDGFKPGRSELGSVAAAALKAGDLETKAGKLLQLYKPAGVAAARARIVGALLTRYDIRASGYSYGSRYDAYYAYGRQPRLGRS